MNTSTNTAKLNLNLLDNDELEFGDWITTFQTIHNSNMTLIDTFSSVTASSVSAGTSSIVAALSSISALSSSVSANTSSISANTSSISVNTAAISVNTLLLSTISVGTIPMVSKSSNYTVSATDCGVEIATSTITVGIVGASYSLGKFWVVANTVASSASIDGGGTLINGSATYTLPPSTTVTVLKGTALIAY